MKPFRKVSLLPEHAVLAPCCGEPSRIQFHYIFLPTQMLSAAWGTAIPLILKLKELLCQDACQLVSSNTSTISTSVLLIEVFLKICANMPFLIMLFFIKIFIIMYVFRVTWLLISMNSQLYYHIHFTQIFIASSIWVTSSSDLEKRLWWW